MMQPSIADTRALDVGALNPASHSTATEHSHPSYRPDIDGLRAIAIGIVVLFHAFPKALGGGFIGVDVFFVISGYLISGILLQQLRQDAFSLTDFYVRRVRRIFPALLAVLTTCITFGAFALFADEYRQLGKHVAGGAGFAANLVLVNELGYFDNAAETKPLLHLWSLGVEEQFYLLWPLLLWLIWKGRLRLGLIITALALTSFGWNLLKISSEPTATFFLPHTRFWELLVGAGLAWSTSSKFSSVENLSDIQRNLLSWGGMLLLLAGLALINNSKAFPGAWAMLPVAGSAGLIAAGPRGWWNQKLLASRPMVGLGLISYPLYLWHWPLLSFATIVAGETPTRAARALAVLGALVLAWLTAKFIEKPLRFGAPRPAKLIGMLLMMAIIGAAGFNIWRNDGFPERAINRFAPYKGDTGHQEFHEYLARRYPACLPTEFAQQALRWEGIVRCRQSRTDLPVDTVLLGDSHAEHLFPGLAEQLQDHNIAFYIQDGLPLLGRPDFAATFRQILSTPSIRRVLIAAHWSDRIAHQPAGTDVSAELKKVIDRFKAEGKEVYLVDDVPTFPLGPARCLGRFWHFSAQTQCDAEQSPIDQKSLPSRKILERLTGNTSPAHLLSLQPYLCDGSRCHMTVGDYVLYRDPHHLNLPGSRFIAARLLRDHPTLRQSVPQ